MLRTEKLTRDNLEAELLRSQAGDDPKVIAAVRAIIEAVAARGDEALVEYSSRFDKVELTPETIRVVPAEMKAALAEVPAPVLESLKLAADRIRDFHIRQLPASWEVEEYGVTLGQRLTPIDRVGLYVPGGQASYPSSVLMNAVPAQIAGVREIAVCVPPGPDGRVNAYVLAAASIIGVDEIFRVGGAQAIAALAYGTKTIKAVGKITGPGNVYVAVAKKLVVGKVDIDMVAGPTEVVIVADSGARPDFIAADMIAQAEHDAMAAAILITTDESLAAAVSVELERQLADAPRAETARRSLADNGRIYIVDGLDLALDFVNGFAPEHLEIMTADPEAFAGRVRNAGAIFLGDYTPEAIGDYIAGSNHVLPTFSTAKFYSPLGVYDFVKWTSVLRFTREAAVRLGPHAVRLADVEGLFGHAASVEARLRAAAPEGALDDE